MSEIRVNRIAVNTDPSIDIASPISTNVDPSKLTLPQWTNATRPSSPSNGQLGLNNDLGIVEYYNNLAGGWIPVYQAGVYADPGPGQGYSAAQGADDTVVATYTNNSMTQYKQNNFNQGAANAGDALSYTSGCGGSFAYHDGHQVPAWWPMYHAIRVTSAQQGKILNTCNWYTHVNAIGNVDFFGTNQNITAGNYTNESLWTHLGRVHFGGSGGGGSDCTIYTRTFNPNNYGYQWYMIKGVDNQSTPVNYPNVGSQGGWAMYRMGLGKA